MSSEGKKPGSLKSGDLKAGDLKGLSGEERRRLLEKLMRQKQAEPRFYPLSFPQQQLWFLDQLEGDTPAYHVSQLYALRGELSVAALERAVAQLVRRHDSLRTVFVSAEGKARQAVLRSMAVPLPVVDLSRLSGSTAAELSRRWMARLVRRSFSLRRGPLLRLLLMRLGKKRWQLAVDMHHIISDVWSIGVLTQELGALYSAQRRGEPVELPPLPLQYGDFARWQRQWLEGERLEKLLGYWRQRLAGAPPVLELPTDRPRPAEPTGRGALVGFQLDAELYRGVRRLGRGAGATPFMVLLAAFLVLLQRYSGQSDLCVGMPIANRTRSEVEGLIGFFVNTLVLRGDLSGSPSFQELLKRVTGTTVEAYDYQDLPFEKLVEELQPQRDLSHHPLFQVLFQLQTTSAQELQLEGLELRREIIDSGQAMFDLLFYLEEAAEGAIAATVQYALDLFDTSTVERMGRHYRTLVASVVADPELPVTRLQLLPAAERHQMLVVWNQGGRERTAAADGEDAAVRLDELFFQQALRTPEAVALVHYRDGDSEAATAERWTYGELAARVVAWARYLEQLGVGPETSVAVCLPRQPELVTALLAVLTAGGTYVPVDPAYPRERVEVMLEDSGARWVLGTAETLERLPESRAQGLAMDGDGPALEADGAADWVEMAESRPSGPAPAKLVGALAYMIFTSGSTGRPKAVAIEHRSAVHMVRWALERFSAADRAVMLAATSVCFDLSVFELFAGLCGGSRVVLVQSALELAEVPEEEGVSLINTVPSAMTELVRLEALPPSVKVVNLAGEPLQRVLVDSVRQAHPGVRVFNLYGPSEDTTYSTEEEVPADASAPAIGRPLPGTQAYLLDRHGEPVPVGVVGELYLGGDGLARGYRGRPGLTAGAFVPDPFSPESESPDAQSSQVGGRRLYRTGDLARFLPDGRMMFLGRRDHQVKVRGFRIELGEVEAALLEHAEVREALVSARGTGDGEMRLVAFVALGPEHGEVPGEQEEEVWHRRLQGHLRRTLPDYMLPSVTVLLAELPRTPNGKVDRKALPDPELKSVAASTGAAARTPLEEVLCGIWAEVLGLPQVSVDANFFELGGHSLLATQVVSRLRTALGVDPSLKILFQAPTVAQLARRLEDAHRPALPEIPAANRDRPLPLSFSQERLWFFERLIHSSSVYNIPGALQVEGELQLPALVRALSRLTARHESLRTRFAEVQGRPVQAVVPASEAVLPWSRIDLQGLDGQDIKRTVGKLVRCEARRPFGLRREPGWRVVLVAVGPRSHRLLVTFHHILADGWSQGVFFRDLGELYNADLEQRRPQLPPLPVHFPDYALWQRRWLRGEALEEQLSFWRQRLEGAPAVLELPTDRPRPAVQTFHGAITRVSLPEEALEVLENLARRSAASLFMVLLAGFDAVVHRITGAQDLCVGVPIANRHRLEVENLIGFLVNTLVLRATPAPELPFAELLEQVRESTLEAYAHQDLPFEKLVEELRPERDLSHAPLFQVMFSLLDGRATELRLKDLEVTVEAPDSGTSKFDLTLHAEQQMEGMGWTLEYNRDLFDAATVERFAGHLRTLLAGAAAEPGRALAELPLLSPSEQRQLAGWNDTRRSYGAATALHRMFEEQAELLPEAIALEAEDRSYDYRSLNRLANVLAHRLMAAGVGTDVLVGVFMERSAEMVISLLAILKAGGAYVPLDPEYPAERLAFMVGDAGVPLVLTLERLEDRLPASSGTTVWPVAVEQLEQAVAAGEETSNPRAEGDSNALAYMIYTSGSTGRPKGAMNSHGAIFNRLLWMQEAYRLDHDDRVLQKTPFSFDVSVWEFFWPLITAARLVMARPGGHQDPQYLAEIIQRRRITTLHFVPSMLQVFLERADIAGCRSLRRVICSGEALPADLVARFHQRSGAQLHNLYGPTEAAIDVTFWHCRRSLDRRPVPIGAPITNTQIHVLDRGLRPVPVGVPGELLIGGVNLARGYRGRPSLTAQRFIPDPFAATPGQRLYRTGDEVRWAADGVVEFIGRLDFQVKLRGLRIELGEIEAALVDTGMARECVVLVREDDPGDQRLVAYWVPASEHLEAEAEAQVVQGLREELRRRLPDYMVPGAFVALEELPLSPNGKVERRALPRPRTRLGSRPDRASEAAGFEPGAPQSGVAAAVAALWRDVLKVDHVGMDDNFFDLGGHSLLLLEVQQRLEEVVPVAPSLVELFQYPTVRALVDFLQPAEAGASPVEVPLPGTVMGSTQGEKEIAVVAVNGRFPGAQSVEELWSNLCGGVEGISFFTAAELERSPFQPGDPSSPDFVKAGGLLSDVELFDAGFFGYTPREAEVLDPQQRLFLECSWEALEFAGIDCSRTRQRIGVWAGAGLNSYLQAHLLSRPEILASTGAYQLMLANDKDFLATRVAYKLGLRGPAATVQTACSTSLVAVHMACRALRGGECDVALAGGATVRVPQRTGYQYQPSMIQSPDGHCRAFDADAKGTVSGNGVGVVVLKRLSQALADGDPVLAVIKGTATNNDGSLKVGYTAPGVDGQTEVIAAALADAEVPAASIGYVEAHGTGTELGDPIEVAALTRAFRDTADQRGSCALGSVKTNLGHLDAAAGVTGLIKAALSLEHELVPPSLHFQRPNPQIDFDSGPFFVNAEAQPWPRGGNPRRAGVSSFGIGGTNAHAVLEEAPLREPSGPSRPVQLLMLSARSQEALDEASERLSRHLTARPEEPLADVAFTLQTGRCRFPVRRVVVCPPDADAAALLSGRTPKRVLTRRDDTEHRPVAFLFPGQGSQYPHMAHGLYSSEPTFRHWLDHCCELLAEPLGLDLREILFPASANDPASETADELADEGAQEGHEDAPSRAARRLRETRYAQPALFAVGYSLARLWQEWGVEPRAMIGHSLGEWVAATVAGVFELEDALALVALRGRLMQAMEPGAMVSVELPMEKIEPLLAELAPERLTIASVNAPDLCAVSGPFEAVEALERELAAREIGHRRLHTSHAFHSAMMEPAVPPLQEAVAAVPRHAPRIPFLSNVTGRWITPDEATSPEYWGSQLRSAVHFAEGASVLLEDRELALLELGPGRSLSTLVRRTAAAERRAAEADGAEGAGAATSPPLTVASSLPSASGAGEVADGEALMTAVARLWLAGVELDWSGFYQHQRRLRRVLPAYPFERQRYWVEVGTGLMSMVDEGKHGDVGKWFYLPSWRRGAPPPKVTAESSQEGGPWLILLDQLGVGGNLASALRQRGETVWTVSHRRVDEPSEAVSEDLPEGVGGEHLEVDACDGEAWQRLLRRLLREEQGPRRVVHCWAVDPVQVVESPESEQGRGALPSAATFRAAQAPGMLSVLALGRALGETQELQEVELAVISSGLHRLDRRDPLEPGKAPLLGPCRVLTQEYPRVGCRSIDLGRPSSWLDPLTAQRLISELLYEEAAPVVAYRGKRRWLQGVEAAPLPPVEGLPRALKRGGVYLITGGLGGVGLILARYLAEEAQARLVLMGRSSFPDSKDWIEWLLEHGGAGSVSHKIMELQNIQEAGSEVLLVRGDVAREDDVAAAVAAAEERFGALDGVVHCAGVVGARAFQPMQTLTEEHCEEQLQAKAYGTLALERALADRPLDFVLVMSSIAGVLGGRFFAAYAGANLGADALVEAREGQGPAPWLSVAWDGWRLDENMGEGEVAELAMTPEEGVEAFRRILDGTAEDWQEMPIIVSTGDLHARRRRWLDRQRLRASTPEPQATGDLHARPQLSTAFVAPESPAEKLLAGIWSQLLGVGEVGVHDDFFELGGHSLLATQLLSRLRKEAGGDLTLQSILEHPTVGEQAQLLGELPMAASPSPDAMVAASPRMEESALPRVSRDGDLPLSFSQERLWFLFRLDPESTAYSLPAAINLRGRLRLDVLRRCFQEITRRHEILRSSIEERDGLPWLRLAETKPQALPLVDLRHLPTWRREPEVYRLAYRDAERPFDIQRGPLIRHTLLRLDRDDHVFIANSHHLVSDGWSGAIFIRELAALYEAFLDGQTSPLPELEIQYADYASWQRGWLQGEVLDTEIEFWRRRLTGLPPVSLPPTDRPRPVDGAAPAGREIFRLEPRDTDALRRFCHRRGLTLFTVSMAAFHLLLARYTGQEDLAVGTPVANRHRPGTEDLIGMFINTVVLRAELAGDPLFEELVEEVKLTTVAAQSHQEVPFEKLVEIFKPERPEGAHPLFQVMLAFNHEPPPEPRLPGLDLSLLDLDSRRDQAVFDISVGLTDASETLEGSVQYNRALYDSTTIQRLFRHYRALLAQAVSHPGRRCSELAMLDAAERHQLLVEWRRPMQEDDLQALLSGLDGGVQSRLPTLEEGMELCLLDRRRQVVAHGAWGEVWVVAPSGTAESWATALATTPTAAGFLPVTGGEAEEGLSEVAAQLVRTEVKGRWSPTGALEWLHQQPTETQLTPRAVAAGTDPRSRRAEEREAEKLWRDVADRTAGLSDDKRRMLSEWLGGSGELPVVRETDSLVLIQPRGEQRPLFFVHPVAGDVTAFVELARHLGPQRPFVGLQAPGLDGVELPLQRIEHLAQRYIEAMRSYQEEGPYLVGGWSMGALVALEIAQRLQSSGDGVELLVLVEPSVAGEGAEDLQDERTLLLRLADDFERLTPEDDGLPREELEAMDRDQQLEYLVRQLRRLSPAYASLDAVSTSGLFEVYKGNLHALANYSPEPYTGATYMILGEQRQTGIGVRELWKRLLPAGTLVDSVPGDHTSLLKHPGVRLLAALLRRRLAALQADAVRA